MSHVLSISASWIRSPDNFWWRVYGMKFFITQMYPSSSYFLSLSLNILLSILFSSILPFYTYSWSECLKLSTMRKVVGLRDTNWLCGIVSQFFVADGKSHSIKLILTSSNFELNSFTRKSTVNLISLLYYITDLFMNKTTKFYSYSGCH
jgi:hypothetical protein